MRILIGWAWTYLIVAELIGASSGISWFINQQGKHFRFDNVFAGIIMIGIIGLVCDQFLAAMGRYLFPYLPRSQSKSFFNSMFGIFLFLPRRALATRSTREQEQRNDDQDEDQNASLSDASENAQHEEVAMPPITQERRLVDVPVS
jgi:hypothetical protein